MDRPMAHLNVEFHPAAIDEARAAREWYAHRSDTTAESFIAELQNGVERIIEAPDRWPAYVHGTRRYLLRKFPYMVVYLERETSIEVIAVAHGRRKPGSWKQRTG